MLEPAIQDFLNERKELWLKKKIKSNTSDEEKTELQKQASSEFSLAHWLPNAAKRAKQLSMASHPGKFSHPNAQISSVIADSPRQTDGFLKTGNADAEPDVFGNAAAMDVYKFLSIRLSDNQTVLSHLENKTPAIKDQLTISTESFENIEQGLLTIKQDDNSQIKTSGNVKQVYFPVNEDYHLLSVLTPSSLIYKFKQRINEIRFSSDAKEARKHKKKNDYHKENYSEIYELSVIGYGGTKPQNISVLNSQNGGAAYLLKSMPPQLSNRTIQAPKSNFFSNTLWIKAFEDDFKKFHNTLINDTNNIHIRKQRDRIVRNIIYQVVDRLWLVRHLDAGWSDSEHYQHLPSYQKIWLDQAHKQEREKNPNWVDAIKNDLSLWFLNAYKKNLGKNALNLGDEQQVYFKDMINECEEALR